MRNFQLISFFYFYNAITIISAIIAAMTSIPNVAHPPVSSESSLAHINATTGITKNIIRIEKILRKSIFLSF